SPEYEHRDYDPNDNQGELQRVPQLAADASERPRWTHRLGTLRLLTATFSNRPWRPSAARATTTDVGSVGLDVAPPPGRRLLVGMARSHFQHPLDEPDRRYCR